MTKLPKELSDKWATAAARPGQKIPVGNTVVCDVCHKDFTNSDEHGGFIFGSYAYCPECAPKHLPSLQHYGEELMIRAYCPPDVSFADFVRTYRRLTGSDHVSITM